MARVAFSLVKGILIDLGGVLIDNDWRAAARARGARLRVPESSFLAALFEGSDDQVLVGRVSEPAWWERVRDRLQIEVDVLDELRADLAARERWEDDLVALLRQVRGATRIAIVSNAWPGTRARIVAAGVADIADEIVISAEVGCAKPDARIFQVALESLALRPHDALFIDDTARHVDAAAALGMLGHVHRDPGSTAAAIARFVATGNQVHGPSNAGGA